jgi:hypothetical protein
LTPLDPETRIDGTITLIGSKGYTYSEFKSFLFDEHFPDMPHINELYSIRYDSDEIGVYDYITNRLMAKYVSAFDGTEELVRQGRILFRFRENILRGRMDSYRCHIMGTGPKDR